MYFLTGVFVYIFFLIEWFPGPKVWKLWKFFTDCLQNLHNTSFEYRSTLIKLFLKRKALGPPEGPQNLKTPKFFTDCLQNLLYALFEYRSTLIKLLWKKKGPWAPWNLKNPKVLYRLLVNLRINILSNTGVFL